MKFFGSDTDAQEVYSSFAVCLEFLSRAFLREPEERALQRLVDEDLFSEWPLPGREDMSEGLRCMQRFSSEWESGQLPYMRENFTRLFIGLERTLAPPYSSVYLGKEGILFDEETLKVRDFYTRFGLELKGKDIVPDDHIGIELHFLSTMCTETASAIGTGDQNHRRNCEAGIKSFLSDHLLLWIDPLAQNILENTENNYFRGIAFLSKGTVLILSEFLVI
ncbi:molecular chaperone [Acidobacteriota bacterium]